MARNPSTAGYIRVSSAKQRDASESPDNQRQRLVEAGCTQIYEDLAVSGYKRSQRKKAKAWQQLWGAIERGEIKRLLAVRIDRYGRRDELVLSLVEHCEKHGCSFETLATGAVDLQSPSSWLNLKVDLMFSEYYSRKLSRDIRDGQAAAIKRGSFSFTSAHLAWHLCKSPDDPRKVIPHPDRWDDAQLAITNYIIGEWSTKQMCAFISERHGVMATAGTASKWLRSGWLRGNYSRRETGEVLIAGVCKPLISEEQDEQLQLRIKANTKVKGSRAPHRVYALSGLAYCKHCNRPMTYNRPKTYSYLRCGYQHCKAYCKTLHSQVVEFDLWAAIGLRSDEVASHDRAKSRVQAPSRELLNLRAHAKKLKAALDLVESPGVRADYEEARIRIRELEGAMAPPEEDAPSLWEQARTGSIGWWERKTDAERQSAYLLLMERITLDPFLERPIVDVQWR